MCSSKWMSESLSRVQLFVTPWTVACQVPLSMEFSRQEYCVLSCSNKTLLIETSTGAVLAHRSQFANPYSISWASLVVQTVKNLPATWETQAQNLSWQDPLEKGMATHSSILAWRIPWTEEPGGLQSMGSQRVRHDWATNLYTYSTSCGRENTSNTKYSNSTSYTS